MPTTTPPGTDNRIEVRIPMDQSDRPITARLPTGEIVNIDDDRVPESTRHNAKQWQAKEYAMQEAAAKP